MKAALKILGVLLLIGGAAACSGSQGGPPEVGQKPSGLGDRMGAASAGTDGQPGGGGGGGGGRSNVHIDDCNTAAGYEVSSFAKDGARSSSNARVHVIGIYETTSDHSFNHHPRGAGTVKVDQPGHHVLVLSSYEPTHFSISVANGAVVDRVLLVGYHTHTVSAPAGTLVDDRSGVDRPSAITECGYSLDGDPKDGCDTTAMLSQIEEAVGGAVSTYAGCYHASSFTISGPELSQPPPPPEAPKPPVVN